MSSRQFRVLRVVDADRPVAHVRVFDDTGRLIDGFELDGSMILFTSGGRRCGAPFVVDDLMSRPDIESVATVAHNLLRTLYRRSE